MGRRRLTLSAHPWRRGEHRGRGHAVKERRDGRVRQAPGAMGGAAAPPPHPCPPRWHAPHDYPQLLVLAVLMIVTAAAMATAAAESAAAVAETAAASAVATVVAVAVVARRRQRACYGMVSNRSGGRRNRQQRGCPHSTVSAGLACRRGATATSLSAPPRLFPPSWLHTTNAFKRVGPATAGGCPSWAAIESGGGNGGGGRELRR